MASLKKISQPIISQKRRFDDDHCGFDDLKKTTRVLTKYPPPKMRTGVKIMRDFPPHCGIIIGNVDSKYAKMTSHDKEFGTTKPPLTRPQGKVKFWDPKSSKEEVELDRRQSIKEALAMFDEVYNQMFLDNRSKPREEKLAHWRVPIEAAKIVQQRKKWRDAQKTLGPVSGIQIGDRFNYRSQLQLVGLHCQPQGGIDYTKVGGKNLAISIVDSHRYSNERESRGDVLLYCGQGGVSVLGNPKGVRPEDQKLERGNLALKNSMEERSPVRVIRKVWTSGRSDQVFVYDGLYVVTNYKQEKGAQGNMVFMFQLERVPGQQPQQLQKSLNTSM